MFDKNKFYGIILISGLAIGIYGATAANLENSKLQTGIKSRTISDIFKEIGIDENNFKFKRFTSLPDCRGLDYESLTDDTVIGIFCYYW